VLSGYLSFRVRDWPNGRARMGNPRPRSRPRRKAPSWGTVRAQFRWTPCPLRLPSTYASRPLPVHTISAIIGSKTHPVKYESAPRPVGAGGGGLSRQPKIAVMTVQRRPPNGRPYPPMASLRNEPARFARGGPPIESTIPYASLGRCQCAPLRAPGQSCPAPFFRKDLSPVGRTAWHKPNLPLFRVISVAQHGRIAPTKRSRNIQQPRADPTQPHTILPPSRPRRTARRSRGGGGRA